jgi:hypothetical protein
MKKALLASTAIVAAAAIASPANAADRIKLSVGGYMEQYIGFADVEDDTGVREFATFDEQSDSEVYFSGSTTLDNGIKLAVRMELEGDAAAVGIDESWLDIQTAWGSIRVGGEDPMVDLQAVEPSSGLSDDYNNWVPSAGVSGQVTNDDSYNVRNSGDDNGIHYLSPSIAGFQVGVSYDPEIGVNAGGVTPNRVTDRSSALSATLNWSGSFMDVGIDTGYGFYTQGGDGSRNTPHFESHQFGLNLKFAGFGIGGNYGRYHGTDNNGAGGVDLASDDGHMYQVGVWYSSGPMALGFLHKNQVDDGGVGDNGRQDESTLNSVWFNYTVSDGVRWESMVFNVDYDDETGVDANFTDGGWGVVSGLRLDF